RRRIGPTLMEGAVFIGFRGFKGGVAGDAHSRKIKFPAPPSVCSFTRSRANGLMRAALGKKELDALNRRHLKFNEAEQAAILHKLQSRAAGADEGIGNRRSEERRV